MDTTTQKLFKITQNPQRYSKSDSTYTVSASPSVTPLTFTQENIGFTPIPLLEADGVIVKVKDWYLISPSTLESIKSSDNPHYSIPTGSITVKGKSAKIGGTIPIIPIDISSLETSAAKRDVEGTFAGVWETEYIFEGEKDKDWDIPLRLVKQINFTLNQDSPRPDDKYSWFNFERNPNVTYDIQRITDVNKQSDIVFDKGKLQSYLSEINKIKNELKTDLNGIKDTFFFGKKPYSSEGDKPMPELFYDSSVANPLDAPGPVQTKVNYSSTSELVTVETTPLQQVRNEQQAAVNQLSTTIQDTVSAQQQAFVSAQNADSRTQEYIQQQLDITRYQLYLLEQNLQQQ